ncbi:hypothetical protein CDD82_4943 [Ophiocordyceps australis]|uniref:Uncharacterized protein n=1 Tax=Ophiocordyceps australis TaxID=1399860 RepID=A0A2C5Z081_9HYPO|nr:hypothetical protein CDD82_4943 [Ophiocordyceps australis]
MSTTTSPSDDRQCFDLHLQHGHKDLVQAVAFNTYGDRCATGSVDGRIRVFNRHRDGLWRLCDCWAAHGGEVVELQWLPSTVYPNLIASLGFEGWFRLWAEDASAPPGRRFCSGRSIAGQPAFDTRSSRAPYRSFSIKHCQDSRHTYLALLAADGRLTVYENEEPENLSEYTSIDEFLVCQRPARGQEVSFKVRFDPNPEPCYTALRAGVPSDALGLVVAAMDTVRLYRSRDVITSALGAPQTQKHFYLALDLTGHHGLVRDVSWAPGNIRGYDMIATACQDGYARVFRVDTPWSPNDGKSWSAADLVKPTTMAQSDSKNPLAKDDTTDLRPHPSSSLSAGLAKSLSSASGDNSGPAAPDLRDFSGQPCQVRHSFTELSRLDNHRTPVWRIAFDDDGHVLGSTGDDGRLLCYRQTPDGTWAKSSELAMVKASMAVP